MYTSDECLSIRNFLQVVFFPTTILFDKHSSEVYIQQLGPLPKTAKRALYGNRAFCDPTAAILFDPPNLGSDYQSTLLAPNQ